MNEIVAFRYFNFSVFLHFIGRMLYRTFVPIVLLKSGFSINEVLMYTLCFALIAVISSYISVNIMKKKNIILINIFAILSEIILLFLLFPNKIPYYYFLLIIFFEGLYYGFYYMSYQPIITHYSSKKNIGKNIGNLGIIGNLSNLIAPIIGGLILTFNKIYFIIISITFLILSIFPLIKIVKTDINGHNLPIIKIKKIKLELFNVMITSVFEVTIFFIWAILIYVEGASILQISYIPAAVAFSNIFVTQLIKNKLINFKFRNWIKIIGILGIAVVSIYRYYFMDNILLTNILMGFFFMIYSYGVNHELISKLKGYQTYYSARLQQITSFGPWIFIILLTLIIGLNNIILLPIFFAILYFVVNFKTIKKLLV